VIRKSAKNIANLLIVRFELKIEIVELLNFICPSDKFRIVNYCL